MNIIEQSDLKYVYSWTVIDGDNPKIIGKPDATFFNRNEGYEVLYLINKFAELYGISKKENGIRMERLIHNHLPSNIHSQENVCQWILDNWDNY